MDNRMASFYRVGFMGYFSRAASMAAGAAIAAAATAASASTHDIDGALTLVVNHSPDYLGARDASSSLRPGFLLRWGRLTVSSGGGFAAQREDHQVRGLGLELLRRDDLQVNLGLRFDSGRDESSSSALAGMGDVKATVRARVGASWRFRPDWKFDASWTVDAFGRGGGNLLETALRHEIRIADRLWLEPAIGVNIAGPHYMQAYFGVTEEQSQRSGYAVYDPSLGLRDVSLGASLRAEFGDHWVGVAGASVSRLMGPAADSPLVAKRTALGLTLGVGYRFR